MGDKDARAQSQLLLEAARQAGWSTRDLLLSNLEDCSYSWLDG